MTFHGNKSDNCNECCPDCVIGQHGDDMDGFTVCDGSWSDEMEATGPAKVLMDVTSSGATTVIGKVSSSDSAYTYRLLIAASDCSHYLAAEVELTVDKCAHLKLYKDGVQIGLTQTMWNVDGLDLHVCWDPGGSGGSGSGSGGNGLLRARIGAYGTRAFTTSSGTKAGAEVVTGTVKFDTFIYEHLKDSGTYRDCPDCDTSCFISADSAEDADKTTCLWDGATESSGLISTSGRAKHLVHHPDLEGQMGVDVDFPDGLTKTIRVDINDDDAGSSHHAIYTTTGSNPNVTRKLEIFRGATSLGSQTKTGQTVPNPDALRKLTVCFDGRTFAAYTEAGSMCVLEASTEIPNGVWAALDATALWDNFELRKRGRQEDGSYCGVCGCSNPASCIGCCNPGTAEDAYIVDFGAGGWHYNKCTITDTVSSCNDCANTRGEFVLELNGLTCTWGYASYLGCNFGFCCGVFDAIFTFGISMTLNKDGPSDPRPGFCRWLLVVEIASNHFSCTSTQCYDDDGNLIVGQPPRQRVAYVSDYLEDPDRLEKCKVMPVTLTKVAYGTCIGGIVFCTLGLCPCQGDLPDTITIKKLVP